MKERRWGNEVEEQEEKETKKLTMMMMKIGEMKMK